MEAKRRNHFRPHYPFFVGEHFNNGTHKACWAETIRAHDDRLRNAIFVFVRKPEWLGKLRAKVKDVSHLNRFFLSECFTLESEIVKYIIRTHLFVDHLSTRLVNKDVIFARIRDCLKLLGKPTENAP